MVASGAICGPCEAGDHCYGSWITPPTPGVPSGVPCICRCPRLGGNIFARLANGVRRTLQSLRLIRWPESSEDPYDYRAAVQEIQRERIEDVTKCQNAVDLDPRDAVAATDLGIALFEIGELDRARDVLMKAIELRPDLAIAHYKLGRIFEEKNDHVAARHHYAQAGRLDPSRKYYRYRPSTGKRESAVD